MARQTALLLTILPALAGALPAPAGAQLIQLDSVPEVTRPAPEAPATPEAAPAVVPTERQWTAPEPAAEDRPSAPEELLLPLRPREPQGSQVAGHRMQGEYPAEDFWLFLPRAVDGAMLEITTLSSINLLPGRSEARVRVNGTEIGTLDLDHFSAAGTDRLAVPDGLLRAGRNLVELQLSQVHRVLCGPEASFGIWTDVISNRSGITIPRADLGEDALSFIAATAAQLSQGRNFMLANSDFSQVLAATPNIAQVEKLFGGLPPEIMIGDYYSVAEEAPQLARLTALPPQAPMPDLPAFRRGGDGAIVLLTDSGQADKIASLLTGALDGPLQETPAPLLAPGEARSFAALGIPAAEGRGHYIRETISFRLPWNWLVLASQRAQMRLDYSFDPGLPKGAVLLVKINDRSIRLLPLDDESHTGGRQEPLVIPFAANQLEPGINEITFEALIPGEPADAACAPLMEPAFRIHDTTSLKVPESPRMTLPRIDRTLASIDISRITMSEAAQRTLPVGLLAQIASVYASDPGAESPADPLPRTGAIRIGIPADLSMIPGDIVSRNVAGLEEALLSPPIPDGEGVDPWANVDQDSWWSVLLDRRKASDSLRALGGKVASLWRGPESDLGGWLVDRSAEAMLLQPSMEEPENLWLVVRPNTDYERLVASLADMQRGSDGPKGQVSLFGYDGSWEVWRSANRPVTMHEPLSFANARAVVGNYVTLSPGRYIAPLFLLAVVCALSMMGLLIASRRRQK
ncbi:MAG: cellulose biosynthesis cyclic di-GMP-binding regulatory protein BcsB [Rhodobacteraceae bacterium]|nr:cellulose biosynthesis cyclic di-GMP-binding regulatory protein BcsB [Paracoccaceae bacterium]MBR9822871.1 cellulose biosynthesis cyclic di-GMP-binding regulatory protein BcsB [Paracoccaceae bacterium]